MSQQEIQMITTIASQVGADDTTPRNGSSEPDHDHPPRGLARVHKFISSEPCLNTFPFLIPVLYVILQVMYQGKSLSPFDTHPANMWASIIATFAFCLAFAATQRVQQDTISFLFFSHVTFLSGALSSASIVSIFLPSSLGLLVFGVWFLLLVLVAFDLIFHFYQNLYQRTEERVLDTIN